jgi:hypothetical protein
MFGKKIKELNERIETLESSVADQHASNNAVHDIITKLCPHDEYEYSVHELWNMVIDYGPRGIQRIPFCPPQYGYEMRCALCGDGGAITKDEYDEAMNEIELASIELDREALEARQQAVMEAK